MEDILIIEKIATLQRNLGQYPSNPCTLKVHYDGSVHLEVDYLPKELAEQLRDTIGEWSFNKEKAKQIILEEEINLLKSQLKELL